MNNRERALEFIRRFCDGKVDALAPLLAEDLEVQGPSQRFHSKAEYLEALARDPPDPAGFEVTSVTESEDGVAVFWEYQKVGGSISIAQLFRCRESEILEILLVFDQGQAERFK